MTQGGPRVHPTYGAAPQALRAAASLTPRTPPFTHCTRRTLLLSKPGHSTLDTPTYTHSPVPTITVTSSTWASRAWRSRRCFQSMSRGTTSRQVLCGCQEAHLHTYRPSSAAPHRPPLLIWTLCVAPALSPVVGVLEVLQEGVPLQG